MGSHFSSQGGSWSPRRDAGPRRCCSPQGASGLGVRLHPHGEWMEDLQVVPGAPATERELGHVGKPDVRTWAPGQWCQLRAQEEEGSKPLCGRKVNLKKKKKKSVKENLQQPGATGGMGTAGGRKSSMWVMKPHDLGLGGKPPVLVCLGLLGSWAPPQSSARGGENARSAPA